MLANMYLCVYVIGSIVDVLLECIRACNVDVRSSVLSNLVYAGEGSNLQGMYTVIL